jgi:hypothetical protein
LGSLWLRVFKAAFDAAGAPVGEFTLGAIDALLAVNAEQVQILRRTEGKVDDLLHGPFQAGIDWLDDARKPHRSAADRAIYVERAKERFVDAQAQLRGHTKALSQVHVAVTYALSGHPSDWEAWLTRAQVTADETILAAVREAADSSYTVFFGRLRKRGIKTEDALREVERSGPIVEGIGEILHKPIAWEIDLTPSVHYPGLGNRGEGAWQHGHITFRRNDESWEAALPFGGDAEVVATLDRIREQSTSGRHVSPTDDEESS